MTTANTRIFAATDEGKAAEYVAFRKGMGDNVVVIKTTDAIHFTRDGVTQDSWDSGPDKDWTLVIATKEQFVTPAKIEP